MNKGLIGIIFAYLLCTLVLTWPLALGINNHVVNAGDPLFYAWNLSHNWQAFQHGLAGLLDTNIYYPTTNTLAYSDTLFVQTILTAPILALTNNPILAENIYILATFPIAAFGMYVLSYWVSRNAVGSLLAGLFYALSYPRLGQLGHISIISSQWLPYLFLSLLQFLQKQTTEHFIAVMIWFLLLLGSTIYFGVIAAVGCLAIILTYWLYHRRMVLLGPRPMHKALLLLPFFAILILLIYPYIRLKAEHPEIKRSLEESSSRAAYQEDYTAVLPTSLVLSRILPTKEGERTLYPTLTLVLLGSVGLWITWRSKRNIFFLFSAVGITALLLSFGPERPFRLFGFDSGYIRLPYYWLYRLFPLLQTIRVPARFSILFILALCVFASLGLAAIKSHKKRLLAAVVACLFFFLEVAQKPLTLVAVPTYGQLPVVYQWLKNQPDVKLLIELPIGKIDQGKTTINQQVQKQYSQTTIDDPLVLETYRTYFSGYHGKYTINGYSGFVPQSYQEAVGELTNFPTPAAIAFLIRRGVSHVIVHSWQYQTAQVPAIISAIEQNHNLTLVAQFDGDYVYSLNSAK